MLDKLSINRNSFRIFTVHMNLQFIFQRVFYFPNDQNLILNDAQKFSDHPLFMKNY